MEQIYKNIIAGSMGGMLGCLIVIMLVSIDQNIQLREIVSAKKELLCR